MGSFAHTNFEAAFNDGTVFVKNGDEMTVSVIEEGTFCSPSGQILVCDPGFFDLKQCLRRQIRPGCYSVSLACWGCYIACVKVQLTSKRVERWENAERVCDQGTTWQAGQMPGFGVDSGMGAIIDGEVARRLEHDETWFERFCKEFDQRQGATCQLVLDEETRASLVACHAGYGDGYYPCFWGLDQHGEPACLVVDFLVFVEGVEEVHDVTDLRFKFGQPLSDSWFVEHGYEQVQLNWRSSGKLVLRFECSGWDEISLILADGTSPGGSHCQGGMTGRTHELEWQISEQGLKDAKIQIKKSVGVRALPARS